MADLQNGILVQHATLGVGKIVALEANAVHVFFPDSDKRFAAKLRLPTARPLLRTEGFEPNAWLEGLTAFALDPKLGRYALAASWLTHDEALEQFRAVYPGGFADPGYVAGKGGRGACWRAAHDKWSEVFGKGESERLLDEGDLDEVVKRALQVEKAVAALHPPADAGAVKEALSVAESTRPFCAALFDVLSVPSPGRARFDRLFAAARGLPVDAAQQWLVATLFPFIASPGRHVLVRPKITCEAAARLGCDVGDDGVPNWQTYAAVRALSTQLAERLKPDGATDFVDVEAFLHVTATTKRRAARSTR
jgi:hypothetical protein